MRRIRDDYRPLNSIESVADVSRLTTLLLGGSHHSQPNVRTKLSDMRSPRRITGQCEGDPRVRVTNHLSVVCGHHDRRFGRFEGLGQLVDETD